jgi:hypothetical protein
MSSSSCDKTQPAALFMYMLLSGCRIGTRRLISTWLACLLRKAQRLRLMKRSTLVLARRVETESRTVFPFGRTTAYQGYSQVSDSGWNTHLRSSFIAMGGCGLSWEHFHVYQGQAFRGCAKAKP